MEPLNILPKPPEGREQSETPCCCPETETSQGTALFSVSGLKAKEDCACSAEPCCGPPPGPRSGTWEQPGYRLMPYVTGFVNTPVGFVPQVDTGMSKRDKLQTILTRVGIIRNDYSVAPGLYSVGSPEGDSPVLVTANYKLSFDALRKELNSTDAWILVLDTRGINVWCAAGKGLFSHTELIRQVRLSRLESIVNHCELILPQLGATGVSARQVKSGCGFRCIWGPIRASDIPAFLENGKNGEPAMRRVSFSLKERVELIPVELTNLGKIALITLALSFVLSGIGPGVYSLSAAWSRGLPAAWSFVVGALIGTVAVPVLLPVIPGRPFALKGGLAGIVFGGVFLLAGPWLLSSFEYLALFLWILVVSSFLAMNFTGSTPYTSPSGVEKEMKRAMPLQGAGLVLSLVFWISAGFLG